MPETYLFMPLGPGKTQILWTERKPVLVLNQHFLITYSPLTFVCVVTSGQRFLIKYSPLIFVCMGCLAQQLKINRKYTACYFECTLNCTSSAMTPSTNVFFNDVFIAYFHIVFISVLVFNQRLLMTYSPPIFVCVGCLACAHN